MFDFMSSLIGSFLGIGLYEKYFKGYSVFFWDFVERKLLESILNIMDYKIPDIFNAENPAQALRDEFLAAAETSASNLKAQLPNDLDSLYNKFLKIYDPEINAKKLLAYHKTNQG